jgi:hypothetical protein
LFIKERAIFVFDGKSNLGEPVFITQELIKLESSRIFYSFINSPFSFINSYLPYLEIFEGKWRYFIGEFNFLFPKK